MPLKIDNYVSFLSQYSKKYVYICPYPGNSGDELIVRGTIELIKHLNILQTYNPESSDIILYPGGNPTMWKEVIFIWRNIWQKYPEKPFVIGPITYSNSDDFWINSIKEIQPNILLCAARDKKSFNILQDTSSIKCKKILSHDPAFYLHDSSSVKKWLNGSYEDHNLYSFRCDHEGHGFSAALSHNKFISISQRIYRKNLIRKNLEKKILKANRVTQSSLPKVIKDVSLANFDIFLDLILRAKEVHTDRLHVMICAALLKKKIFAYSTTYGKLEAVYEQSMQDWTDVTFVS